MQIILDFFSKEKGFGKADPLLLSGEQRIGIILPVSNIICDYTANWCNIFLCSPGIYSVVL